MNKFIPIIQARMGSSRLPGKSLMKIGEYKLIDWVINYAKKNFFNEKIYVATTKSKDDDTLVEYLTNKDIKIFETHYSPVNSDKFDKNNKYLIFSGIGNPDIFKKTLTENKLNIVKEIKFPDHYNYTKNDIDKIKMLAKNLNAKILTTEKDYVKIDSKDRHNINFFEIELCIKDEDKLIDLLKLNI